MKIPDNAKKVFNGIIYDIYQWEQLMFDGSCQTFECAKRKNISQIIPYKDSTYYLAYEEQPGKRPYYSLIGGQVELPETPEEGAKRELFEEAGFDAQNIFLIQKFIPCSLLDWTISVYKTNDFKEKNSQMLDAGERINIIGVPFRKFINIVLSEEFSGKEFANYVFRLKVKFGTKKLQNSLFPN